MGFTEAVSLLRQADSFVLVGHVKPDGDSIGCQLALAEGLEQLGKTVSIQAFDPVPRIYTFLKGSEKVEQRDMISGSHDCAVLVEVPRLARSGFTAIPAEKTLGIDHHPDYELNADAEILDTGAAAAAELVYQLLLKLDVDITKSMAESLLTGIATDCGFFKFGNTNPETLETAAKLVRLGANLPKIADNVYNSYPFKRLALQSDLLKSMKMLADGSCSLLVADYKMMEKNAYYDELFEGMVNVPMMVDSILVSILARQNQQGGWRFSLRGKGELDVGGIARAFDGGGHRNAAGFRSQKPITEIAQELEKRVNELLSTAK